MAYLLQAGLASYLTKSAYLDRLVDLVKTNPRSESIPDAIRQIVFVYESQGKTVEAAAWREKLKIEHTNTAPASIQSNPGK
jgi:hypothetical protein